MDRRCKRGSLRSREADDHSLWFFRAPSQLKGQASGSSNGVHRCAKRALRRQFSALEALIGPHVSPVAVASTVGNTQVVKIAVDDAECSGTLQIKNNVRVRQKESLFG